MSERERLSGYRKLAKENLERRIAEEQAELDRIEFVACYGNNKTVRGKLFTEVCDQLAILGFKVHKARPDKDDPETFLIPHAEGKKAAVIQKVVN